MKVGEPAQASLPQAPDLVAKRATEQETTSQEAQVLKKTRTEESKRPRLDPGVSSAASAQGPVPAEPEPMEVSASSEPASSSKRPYPGGRTNLLLTLRTGYLASVAGEPYPVCEERFDTDIYDKFETSYWDDVSGKPLRPELVQEARKEEVSTIREMGVWEVIPRPKGEKVITTRWVDINKKDEATPKYRSRLVARELKKRYNGGLSNGGQAHLGRFLCFDATHQCSANLVRPRNNQKGAGPGWKDARLAKGPMFGLLGQQEGAFLGRGASTFAHRASP